jgi:hypothetical protein
VVVRSTVPAGQARPFRDVFLNGSQESALEWRFVGDASTQLNDFLVQ